MKDRAVKKQRIIAILDRHGVDALVLRSQASLAWYLDGARIHVNLSADPIVSMRVTRDVDELVLSSNERRRLLTEELPDDLTIREHPWFESPPSLAGLGEDAVAADLRAARAVLLPDELARYRALCRDAAVAVTDALLDCEPAWSEQRLAARLASAVVEIGADPMVVLVAGDSRLYPHPLPTHAALGRRVMVVVCARRHGLIANLSRWVTFGPATSHERDAEQRILAIERQVFDAMRPGIALRDILSVFERAYPESGFPADQWRRHHQGGAAGYAGRDPRATPETTDLIAAGQAFTWNPWVPGAKVEDTVLFTDDARIEPLTLDPRWPTTTVGDRDRPLTLAR